MYCLRWFIAAREGATVANYVEVSSLTKDGDGKLNGAVVTDKCVALFGFWTGVSDEHVAVCKPVIRLTGKSFPVKAKVVVNATGPFADAVRLMDNPAAEKLIVPAGGVHVILPDHFSPERFDWRGFGRSWHRHCQRLSSCVCGCQNGPHCPGNQRRPCGRFALGAYLRLFCSLSCLPSRTQLFFLPWEGSTICGTTDSKT